MRPGRSASQRHACSAADAGRADAKNSAIRPSLVMMPRSVLMSAMLANLEQHWVGAGLLVVLVLVLMVFVRNLFWLMGWGRYKRPREASTWTYYATQFIAKTISEFRHLLALLIFLLFACSVILAIVPGLIALNVEQMTEGLEGVAAALGGLVGSIIGYYFGEQVATANVRTGERADTRGEAIQEDLPPAEVSPARIPPAPSAPDDNPAANP